MQRDRVAAAIAALVCLIAGSTGTTDQPDAGSVGPLIVRDYVASDVRRLTARTVRVYEAPEADQGVAADGRFFYPVDNTVLAKYDIASGRLVDRWVGPRNGLVRHMNSCLINAPGNYKQQAFDARVDQRIVRRSSRG